MSKEKSYDLLPKEISVKEYNAFLSAINKEGIKDISTEYSMTNKRDMHVESEGTPELNTRITYECSKGEQPIIDFENLFEKPELQSIRLCMYIDEEIVGYDADLKTKTIFADENEGITDEIEDSLENVIKSMSDSGFNNWKLHIPRQITRIDKRMQALSSSLEKSKDELDDIRKSLR